MKGLIAAALLLLSSSARAFITVNEGLATTKDAVYIGTTTPQLLLNGGTYYAGTVPSVSMAASSNVVVGNCVIYSSGGITCLGVSLSTAGAGPFVLRTGDTMTGALTVTANVTMGSMATVSGNAFSVGGSTFVVSGGNVGIGTTSPGTLLDVNGVARSKGVTDGSAAASTVVGYSTCAYIASYNTASNNVVADIQEVTLDAGDWWMTGTVFYNGGSATAFSEANILITDTSGNNFTNGTVGDNWVYAVPASGAQTANRTNMSIPNYSVITTTQKSYYLKAMATFTGTAVSFSGKICARRMR